MGTIEPGQPMAVFRKMCRYPVDNHTYALLVTLIDEILEIIGVTKTAGRSKQANRLIPPGTIERVFRHWQQLQMGVAHLFHIGDQLLCQFTVTQILCLITLYFALPRPRCTS